MADEDLDHLESRIQRVSEDYEKAKAGDEQLLRKLRNWLRNVAEIEFRLPTLYGLFAAMNQGCEEEFDPWAVARSDQLLARFRDQVEAVSDPVEKETVIGALRFGVSKLAEAAKPCAVYGGIEFMIEDNRRILEEVRRMRETKEEEEEI